MRIRWILFALVVVLAGLATGCSNLEFLDQTRYDAGIGPIYGSKTVGQSFVARADNLSKVGVLTASYGVPTAEVVFHLRLNPYDEASKEQLARAGRVVGEIYGARTVGQTFICSVPALSGIKILAANYNDRPNTQDVIFHLKENPDAQEDLRTVVVNASQIPDNQYYEFSFLAIPEGEGKLYYFYLESPQSRPGDAITVRYSSPRGRKEKELVDVEERYLNGLSASGDLIFKEVNETDLVVLRVNGSQIPFDRYYKFSFPPLPHSGGKSYYFYLESPESRTDSAVTVRYERSGRYRRGRMYVNGSTYGGSLAFRTYYYVSLKSIMRDFWGHVWPDKTFLVFYLALLTLAGYWLTKLRLGRGEQH